MHAIVIAGGQARPGQPLYEITHGEPKSMLALAGKPMVQWVLDAFGETDAIEQVVVVGLQQAQATLACRHPLVLLPDQGDILDNILAGAREVLRGDPGATHAILATGDIPALRGEIIDWLINEGKGLDQDMYYTVVERRTMEACFPASRRTYLRLKDVELCGGDIHCIRLRAADEGHPRLKQLIAARKNPLQQASMIGFDILLNLLLRRYGLRDVEAAVSRRMGIRARAVTSPFAEAGMDVDKPFQFEIMQTYFNWGYERNTAKAK